MQTDLRRLIRAAAPGPSGAPDVEALWRRATRQRALRRLVAVSFAVALAAGSWTIVQRGYVSALLSEGPLEPAGPAPSEVSPQDPSGRLYLENACTRLPDCSLTVVDLRTGTSPTFPLPELALGDAQFRLVRSGSKLVFRGSTSGSTGSDIATFAVDLDLEDPPRSLGDSWYFVPSATEGRVWLAMLDPESPETVRALEAVQEVTVEKEVTVPRTPLPPDRWSSLAGATRETLVFHGEQGLEVWDPVEREIRARLPGPFVAGTSGDLVAWCDQGCRAMHISNVSSGEEMLVEPGGGFAFEETFNGAFSPDGSLLAVPVSGDGERRVALIDVTRGTAAPIEGSELDESYGAITWSSSGEWLFFDAGGGRLMAYRRGSQETRLLPVHLDGDVGSMAAS